MTRGDVHRVRLPAGRGREQAVRATAWSSHADELLGLSTAVIAPTSQSAATFRPDVEVAGQATGVLVELLRAVDVDRLGDRAGRLTAPEQGAVDEALMLVLGL